MPEPLAAVLLPVWAGLCAADQRALGGRQLHQPIVAAAGAGLILGAPERAVPIALWMQLVWVAPMPVGGRLLPDTGTAAVAAAIFATVLPPPAGLLAGLAAGLIFAAVSVPWDRALRAVNEDREEAALASSGGGGALLARTVFLGVAGPFVRGAACAIVCLAAAYVLAPSLPASATVASSGVGLLLVPGLLIGSAVVATPIVWSRLRPDAGRSAPVWIALGVLLGISGRLLLAGSAR